MYKKIPLAGIGHKEWLEYRKTGIGGSDAGAICGLNPYSSPMKVFWDKTSEGVEEQDNEAIRIGHDLEPYVAERFMEATGLKVRRSNYMYRSEEHPFMIADVDRLVVGEDAGLECKTASAYNASKWKDGEIPPHYVMQCYHYMAVTGKRTWYIAAVILGQTFVYNKLVWDDEIIRLLVEMEKDFWENHVVTGVMPEPDGSESYDDILGKCFHTAKKKSSIELVGFDSKLERRAEIIQEIAKLQQEQSHIEQEVKLFMKDNELASNGIYRVAWKNVSAVWLDAKRIKKEKPEIYKEYAKKSVSRRFQIHAA